MALLFTAGIAGGLMALSDTAIAWAKDRGISRSTLEAVGVASGTANFRSGKSEALYFKNGDGWKARSLAQKDYTCKQGCHLALWGLDEVKGSERVIITEGEMDRLALVEAGFPASETASVPSGAPGQESEDPLATHKWAVEALEAGLNRCKRFVIWTDADAPGRALRRDLERIFGPARCWHVEAGKDANDYLMEVGPGAVQAAVEGAKAAAVEGLYRLDDLPERPPLTLWTPGFPEWESKVHLAPRTVSVVTGHPGHGKTTVMMQIWTQIARRHGVGVCVASFETRAKPHHRRNIRSFLYGKREIDMVPEEIKNADAFINERFMWVEHKRSRADLRFILDAAEVAVVREGCKVLQIDPWNRLESMKPERMPETEYIGKCLDELADFADDLECHVQVLAHPTKTQRMPGKAPSPPHLEDISGSKNWDNKPDQGFVIHRNEVFKEGERKTDATVYVRKVRYEELGYPCALDIRLDLQTGCFVSADYENQAEILA